jgi:carbon-monoxide dehydrogenase medium subunit
MPAVAVALEAEIVVSGPGGRRAIPATEFFLGLFTTAILPNEILVEIRFPAVRQGEGWSFREFARKTGDFALGAAAVRLLVRDGLVEQVRIGLAGAADRPARARDAEAWLAGRRLSDEGLQQAARLTASSVDPVAGASADAAYRRHLAGVLTLRALREAGSRALGGGP